MTSKVKELEEKLESLTSAFNDRVKVIEMQLEDKKLLKSLLKEAEREISGLRPWDSDLQRRIRKVLEE